MPVTTSYPGLYIEELPLSAHSISAAPTSIAAFVGYSHPYLTEKFDEAVRIFSFTDFEREFGGLFSSGLVDPNLGRAVNQFFLNGGSDAYVVGLRPRLYNNAGTVVGTFGPGAGEIAFQASVTTDAPTHGFVLTAKVLADVVKLTAVVTNIRAAAPLPNPSPPPNLLPAVANSVFDLIITYGGTVETYRGIDLAGTGDNGPDKIVKKRSTLVTLKAPSGGAFGTAFASATPQTLVFAAVNAPTPIVGVQPFTFRGGDYDDQLQANSSLDKVEIFNILVLPGVSDNNVLSTALSFAERKRAFMIVDAPYDAAADASGSLTPIKDLMDNGSIPRGQNGAIYFPWLLSTDPMRGTTEPMPPSGFVAGVYARTDTERGVWKAPAGIAATVRNTTGPVPHGRMNDQQHGVLNDVSVNALRAFRGEGTVVFGSRTLVGNNTAYPQSKYVPVRRMTLFIEQTLIANLRWVVFEPNDAPLWIAIRTSVSNFMLSLFNQQALAGTKPSEAFQVKCDGTTTTPDDQANGIVNIVVAFAPLKPAEFVVIKIAQLTAQPAA
jgi:phage tail sheath protein FI